MAPVDLVVPAGEVERLAAPGAAHDLEELAGLVVAGVLVVVDAEPGQLGRLPRR